MTAHGRVPALARAILWSGGILFCLVQPMLLLLIGMPLADTILLAALLVAVPAVAVAQLPLIEGAWVERLPAYWSSIATLALLGTAAWLVGTRLDGPAAIGIVRLPVGSLAAWSMGLAAGGLLTIVLFRQVALWMRAQENPMLRQLLPTNRKERSVFVLLSVAAGVGEEVAYRGYAIPVLTPLLGLAGASVLSSAVFGVLHSYQGVLGMLRTGVMGGVLAWGFLASGSLWPGIIAHTLIDLVAGIVLGERLLLPETSTGVGEDPRLQSSET